MEDITQIISFNENFEFGENKPPRQIPSRNISNIDWFRPKTQEDPSQEALKNFLKKINQEYQNDQQGDKLRDDILFRKTKIICTLGKYTRNPEESNFFYLIQEAICKLIKEGCQIFRINMSIQQNKDLKELIQWIRSAEKITKTKVGILIDLQGPVIRTCEFRNKSALLKGGQEYRILCKRKIPGDETFATVDYKDLAKKIKINDHLIADFGAVCMRVIGFEDQQQFLVNKQLEGVDMNPTPKQIRTSKMSLSFQGQKIRHPDFSRKFAPPEQSSLVAPPFANNNIIPLNSPNSVAANNQIVHQIARSRADTIENDSEVDQISLDVRDSDHLQQPGSPDKLNQNSNQLGTYLEPVEEEKIQDSSLQNQNKKKFKVRFDEAYQANHIEKSRVEHEFFKDALKHKRYVNKNLNANSQKYQDSAALQEINDACRDSKDNDEETSLSPKGPTMGQKFSHHKSTILNSDRRLGNFPELSVIQEERKTESQPCVQLRIEQLDSQENINFNEQITQAALQSLKSIHQSNNNLIAGQMLTSQKYSNSVLPPTEGLRAVSSALNLQNNQMGGDEPKRIGLPPKRGSQLSLKNRKKKIVKKDKKIIVCKVEFDCEIKPHKPLYFPDFDHKNEFEMSVVTQKDVVDIYSCIKLGVDFISVSYVECRQDILEVRELLSIKGRHIKVIAKIQNRKALENFCEILEVADGIIIARGYLGLDLKLEDVAFVQKYLIKQCNLAGKPVILSTQIMESMVTRLRPTRAEVSDISNAVYDGVDCCLLSSETQTGQFYKEACETMSKICYEAEKHIDYEKNYNDLQSMIFDSNLTLSIGEAISNCAVKAAYEISAKLIIVFTNSGQSAITVSKYRPQCPILAVSASDKSAKQCLISKGIYSLLVGSLIGAESLLDKVRLEATKRGLVKKGDYIVVTTGINEGLEGSTNLLKVLQV